VLLEDGVRGGPSPSLKVLEIADVDAKRHASDMLPYLPTFRSMFTPLPTEAAHVRSQVAHVMLDDIECVTQTNIKVRGPVWTVKVSKGKLTPDRSTCDRC